MKEVGKLLGIKMKEIFRIDGDEYCCYRLTNDRLEYRTLKFLKEDEGWHENTRTLTELLNGKLKIIKLPWRPRKNESYYSPCPDADYLYLRDNWDDDAIDRHRLEHNIVFKTKKEAVDMAKKMLAVTKESNE